MKEEGFIQISYSLPEQERNERKESNSFLLFITIILSVLLLIGLARSFVFYSVMVDGPSMNKTLYTGDLLLVNRLISPERYGVVVFDAYGVDSSVSEAGSYYIKRVIAFEGEEVWAENGHIYIAYTDAEGNAVETELEDGAAYYSSAYYHLNISRRTVPEGCYFVLGDNRAVSKDSRSIGFIPKENVLGTVSDFVIENKDNIFVKIAVNLF